MRCQNPDCQQTVKSPAKKTKETGLCGTCRHGRDYPNRKNTVPLIVNSMVIA